jgi:hypothetical protein
VGPTKEEIEKARKPKFESRFEEILNEIEERRIFLNDMKKFYLNIKNFNFYNFNNRLGKGNEIEPIINSQIGNVCFILFFNYLFILLYIHIYDYS